jgi:hypothetical protein
MTKMTNKGKIVYLLSMMVMVFVILGYLSITQLKKSEITRITDELIENIHTTSLDLFKNDVSFFNRELHKPGFFQTGESLYLTRHLALIEQLHALIADATDQENINIDDDLQHIDSLTSAYHSAFINLTSKLKERGLHEWGMEGKLIASASVLENKNMITAEERLMLRIHEKDYMLQKLPAHAQNLQELATRLIQKYQANRAAQEALKNYSSAFNEYVAISNSIGLSNQTGLKMELNQKTDDLLEAIGSLSAKAEEFTIQSYSHGITMFSISIIIGIAFCFVLIILIVQKL